MQVGGGGFFAHFDSRYSFKQISRGRETGRGQDAAEERQDEDRCNTRETGRAQDVAEERQEEDRMQQNRDRKRTGCIRRETGSGQDAAEERQEEDRMQRKRDRKRTGCSRKRNSKRTEENDIAKDRRQEGLSCMSADLGSREHV